MSEKFFWKTAAKVGTVRGSGYALPFSAENFNQILTGYQTPEQITGLQTPRRTELGYQTAKKENLGHERGAISTEVLAA
ncbi:7707_t:CDS:2 [Funneliformis mosseae]|uniref:7707_t:CDS:1 n=1 Tax=Funneliformis mosseae TaxID=27381 RepID=A0A9N9BVJ1_FUNMO|nr:7707_t:CDS:2 [Funneliformis mosseae]